MTGIAFHIFQMGLDAVFNYLWIGLMAIPAAFSGLVSEQTGHGMAAAAGQSCPGMDVRGHFKIMLAIYFQPALISQSIFPRCPAIVICSHKITPMTGVTTFPRRRADLMSILTMTIQATANMAALTVFVKKIGIDIPENISHCLLFGLPDSHWSLQVAGIFRVTVKTAAGLVQGCHGITQKLGTFSVTVEAGKFCVGPGQSLLVTLGAIIFFGTFLALS